MNPKARTQEIVVTDYDGELVIYDLTADRLHHLNAVAAAIFRLCDGRTSIAAIARRLDVDAAVVDLGVQELADEHLLAADRVASLDRRTLLLRLGVAVVLPAIVSMAAPTAAMAASPGHGGGNNTGSIGN